jgi:hypothetical protein
MQQQHKGFTFRTYLRVPARMSMMYVGQDFAGQGIVRELSRAGCRIFGNYPVVAGETMSARISLPMHPKTAVHRAGDRAMGQGAGVWSGL